MTKIFWLAIKVVSLTGWLNSFQYATERYEDWIREVKNGDVTAEVALSFEKELLGRTSFSSLYILFRVMAEGID